MREIDDWFNAYAESHQNRINKLIHWICVPLIFWSVIALLWSIPFPEAIQGTGLNWAYVVLMGTLGWYMFLAPPLAIGMLVISYSLLYFTETLHARLDETGQISLWILSLLVFAIAWVGQFIGHKIEGKKPSFLTDLSFLLIGPLWLLHFIYRKLRLPYK
jgi:uncharacterized membrane protein YGL010W